MKRLIPYTIGFIGIVFFWVTTNIQYSKDHWKAFIESDGKGYYAYLPAIFIYQDLQFGFFEKTESLYYEGRHQDYRNEYKGKIIDKYYCGTAVALTPFFLAGHFLTKAIDGDADGYSKYYCLSVNIAALFYFLATLHFIAKLLKLYEVSDKIIVFTLIAFSFGTNLFYYVIIAPSMSHMYSLFFITVFIYFSKRWFAEPQSKTLIIIGAALGMIALIRPINILIVAILPFVAGSWPTFITGIINLWKKKAALLIASLVFGGICFIQLLIYKIQTGDFIVYSYTNETFLWTNPQLIKVLFGYRKGLFLYTPMLFIALLGLVWFYKKNKFEFYSLILFLCMISYVLSSWWCWWYGGSFGMRAFLEFYPLFFILFGVAFHELTKKYLKVIFMGIAFLLLILCQIQTYQMRYYYIHWGEMSKEQYWRVFLRIDWALEGTHKQKTDLPVTRD